MLLGMCDESVSQREREKLKEINVGDSNLASCAVQVYYHCAIGKPQMVGNRNELLRYPTE